MKGFIDEFNERTEGMTAQIADLTSQLSEKDKTIEELKEELKKKDDENKIALAEVFEENQKLKEHINEANLAVAELYENSIGKNA